MMLMTNKARAAGMSPTAKHGGNGGWEVRPGGMLVQRRNSDPNPVAIPKIRVRVKHGSFYHEISISPHASFGELKKMLAGTTGLHPQDQKIIYGEKERSSKAFLDTAGVSEGSNMVLVEDVTSRERRVPESRQAEKTMDKASRTIAEIAVEVDKLAKKVAALESEICSGGRVEERVLLSLIELLMIQLLKLDEVAAEGDVKLQRREEVRRVQKYIESLDVLKIRNASNKVKPQFEQENKHYYSKGQMPKPLQNQRNPVSVTTKWETFDSTAAVAPRPPFTSSSASGDPFRYPVRYPSVH
ncbi:hypothetical protein NMG60_11030406 [Bertholletia excelsa]